MSDAVVQVVAAVIVNAQDECLLALRPKHLHQGGLWEFPGGKIETLETPLAALRRELREELDIQIGLAQPLLITVHDYPDKRVSLDVWVVREFAGRPTGMEGQQLGWFTYQALLELDFPAANYPILDALGKLLKQA